MRGVGGGGSRWRGWTGPEKCREEKGVRGRGEATEVKAQGRKEGTARAERGLRGQRSFPTLGALPWRSQRKGGLGHGLEAQGPSRCVLSGPQRGRCPQGQACELVVKDVVHAGHLARSGCSGWWCSQHREDGKLAQPFQGAAGSMLEPG